MNGLFVIPILAVVAMLLVLAFELQDRAREARDFDGVDEWEQLQRDLAPRWRP